MSEQDNSHIRNYINSTLTEKKLQDKLQNLQHPLSSIENRKVRHQIEEYKIKNEEMSTVHAKMIETLQEELREMTGLKINAEARMKILENEIKEKEEDACKLQTEAQVARLQVLHKEQLDKADEDKQRLRGQLNQVQKYVAEEAEVSKQLAELTEALENEKLSHKQDVESLERKRIQDTEKLKKDMLYKIKQTKADLLALSDEQLHTTTRLTVLENHRLSTELEYQSKQTEKLIARNQQLEKLVQSLQRDIEVHKEVESELAKRSQYCQKIIKRLNEKIKNLEDEVQGNRQDGYEDDQRTSRMNEDLIRFLEQKLEETMNRIAQAQAECNVLKSENSELQAKLKERHSKYKNLGELLSDYLKDLQNMDPQLQSNDQMMLNIHAIANTPLDQLETRDKAALIIVLLKQIQPYLSPNNLLLPEISQVNIVAHEKPPSSGLPKIGKAQVNAAVQTSFALGTFDLPKLEIDADMVKGTVRPWGKGFKTPLSGRSHLNSSLNRKYRGMHFYEQEVLES